MYELMGSFCDAWIYAELIRTGVYTEFIPADVMHHGCMIFEFSIESLNITDVINPLLKAADETTTER
jgi:hypothetical protein